MRRVIFSMIVLLGFSQPAFAAKDVRQTDEAQRIYSKYGDAIYQVQTIDKETGKKSSIGSGFQFTDDGLIGTNYHVIAEAVRHPENTRLEFLHDKRGRGSLKILSVDVLNDLAILQMEEPGDVLVRLGKSDLPKGARLFSLGNPHDIGFTIIEGTNNGYAKESFAEKIHFSGSLNPGMSGGPALSHDGRVVGVNVSTAGNQISFLVPVEPLKALYASVEVRPEDYNFLDHAAEHIESQLLKGQQRTTDALLNAKWELLPLGPIEAPGRIHLALKCWGASMHQEKDPFRFHRSFCGTQDRIFLGDGFDTGTTSYRYDYITAKESMNPFRFNAFYERQYGVPAGRPDGTEDDVTNFDCETGFVDIANQRWKASFCVRQYKAYPKIWDMQLYMAMTGGGTEGMLATFEALGVSKESAVALARKFMNEIKPRPPEAAPAVSKAAAGTAAVTMGEGQKP